jgi:hypothetical protein
MSLRTFLTFSFFFPFFPLNDSLSPFSTNRAGLHILTATIPTFANSEKRHTPILTPSVSPDILPHSPLPSPQFPSHPAFVGYKPEEDTEVRPIILPRSSALPSSLTPFHPHSGRLIRSDRPQRRPLNRAPICPLPNRMPLPLILNSPGVPAVVISSSDGEMARYATRLEGSEKSKYRCHRLPPPSTECFALTHKANICFRSSIAR